MNIIHILIAYQTQLFSLKEGIDKLNKNLYFRNPDLGFFRMGYKNLPCNTREKLTVRLRVIGRKTNYCKVQCTRLKKTRGNNR